MHSRTAPPRAWHIVAILPLVGLAGCANNEMEPLRRENQQLREQVATLTEQVAAERATSERMARELAQVRGFSAEDLKKIFSPERILIDKLSGGENYDAQPGDDGVTVYFKPVDRDGDTIKAAGDIRVELFDLADPAGGRPFATQTIPVSDAGRHWYGKLMTYHYTVKCPWQGRPKNPEITVRVTFVDYITQRVMTAQAVVTVQP